jgi:hypothetical protein
MRQSVPHRAGGASDVDQRGGSFQLVVAGLVEEVAATDHSRSFFDKVHGGRQKSGPNMRTTGCRARHFDRLRRVYIG